MKVQYRLAIFLLCLELLNTIVGLWVFFPFVFSSKVQVIAMQIIKIELKLKNYVLSRLPCFAEKKYLIKVLKCLNQCFA